MSRSRRGRRSNIGKTTYSWQKIMKPSDEEKLIYNSKQKKKEQIVSKLHLADSTDDFDTYVFIAEYFNLNTKDLTRAELKNSVWDACLDANHQDISNLFDKLNPSYDK